MTSLYPTIRKPLRKVEFIRQLIIQLLFFFFCFCRDERYQGWKGPKRFVRREERHPKHTLVHKQFRSITIYMPLWSFPGVKGQKGQKGTKGEKGTKGKYWARIYWLLDLSHTQTRYVRCITYTSGVCHATIYQVSWSFRLGQKGQKGQKGFKGEKGQKGEKGLKGTKGKKRSQSFLLISACMCDIMTRHKWSDLKSLRLFWVFLTINFIEYQASWTLDFWNC